MRVEVEAKFRVAEPGALTALRAADRLAMADLGPADVVDEVDRYLDTAHGALGAARWACRLRSRGSTTIVSLKGPAEATGEAWLHRRPEVEGPATPSDDPAAWPASEARELLDGLRSGAALEERFTLRQRRTERPVRVRGRRVGTLTLDEVRVERTERRRGTFAAVELELAGDDPEALTAVLHRLAGALAEVPGLVPEPDSKLERAIALLETG